MAKMSPILGHIQSLREIVQPKAHLKMANQDESLPANLTWTTTWFLAFIKDNNR